MRTLLGKMLFRGFYREFGFMPTNRERSPSVHVAMQAVVDGQLSRRASAYRAADRNEQISTEALRKVESAKELVEARSNLRWCQDGVRRAKDSFWHAHGLAKSAGFPTMPKYTDYLDYSSHWS